MKFILVCAALTAIMLCGVALISNLPSTVLAQSTFTYLQPQTSVGTCAWPQGVSSGTGVCPVIQPDGSVNLAFAANGGAFKLVGTGLPGVGFKIGTKITFDIPANCKGTGNVGNGFTLKNCTLVITAIQ